MAKEEEVKIEEKAKEGQEKLNFQKLSFYASQLEGRLNNATKHIEELEKQLTLYQMQDYYQRAQMLCVILANDKIAEDFRKKCEQELFELVYPPQKEEEPKK